MESAELIPVAQYLRMSCEEQRYSLAHQQQVIARYADDHGLVVVRTYKDAGRSGVAIHNRKGLLKLLQDLMRGSAPFRAVLVYDVSRWGRFQDCDEAAHYEFLCKQAGAPIRYCAEEFANDGTAQSSILKALKRTMAGEFSREMSVRGYLAKRNLALAGFRQGGPAGYGLRRVAVTAEGIPRVVMRTGQRKQYASDRVELVPGPPHEVAIVRQIFSSFLRGKGKLSPREIAIRLNQKGILTDFGREWTYASVLGILSNPKYAGTLVWGKTAKPLQTPVRRQEKKDWLVLEGRSHRLIRADAFDRVQKLLEARGKRRTPTPELVESLRKLLAKYGYLDRKLIENHGEHCPSTYAARFGSLQVAYDQVGFHYSTSRFAGVFQAVSVRHLRAKTVERISLLFPQLTKVFRPDTRTHQRHLLFGGEFKMYVRVARQYRTRILGLKRWRLPRRDHESDGLTLVCLLDADNTEFEAMFLLPPLRTCRLKFSFGLDDDLIRHGVLVSGITNLWAAVCKLLAASAVPALQSRRSGLSVAHYSSSGTASPRTGA